MAEHFSIAEVSRLTGLASHTLRYYEQQFPVLLDINRTRGGHRVYSKRHLETLNSILKLLKDEKVSIRKARDILGENIATKVTESTAQSEKKTQEPASADLGKMLVQVLERLDSICRNNDNRDRLLESLLKKQPDECNDELLDQIARCRYETRETMKLCQIVMQQRFKAN